MPVRLQRRRAKGSHLPAGAICITRPTRWGNPFPTTGHWISWAAVATGFRADKAGRLAASLAFYRRWLTGELIEGPDANTESDDLIEYTNGKRVDTATQARGMAAAFAVMMGRGLTIPVAPTMEEIQAALRGHDLACWCPVGSDCHGDILLEIANAPAKEVEHDNH